MAKAIILIVCIAGVATASYRLGKGIEKMQEKERRRLCYESLYGKNRSADFIIGVSYAMDYPEIKWADELKK